MLSITRGGETRYFAPKSSYVSNNYIDLVRPNGERCEDDVLLQDTLEFLQGLSIISLLVDPSSAVVYLSDNGQTIYTTGKTGIKYGEGARLPGVTYYRVTLEDGGGVDSTTADNDITIRFITPQLQQQCDLLDNIEKALVALRTSHNW